jgi:hypothetical protein
MKNNTHALHPFRRNDWYGFAGAERFADGSEPLIGDWCLADGGSVLMVVSSGLSTIMLFDGDSNPDEATEGGGYMLENNFANQKEALQWFKAVKPLTNTRKSIFNLGFKA